MFYRIWLRRVIDMGKHQKIILIGLLVALVVIAGCEEVEIPGEQPKVPEEEKEAPIELEATQELKKFNSVEEVKEFLQKNSQQQPMYRRGGIISDMAMMESAVSKMSGDVAPSAAPASEYSTTNIQVEGVDEADFVKNDGKYIYVIAQNKLVIVDAFPADEAKKLSTTELKGRPRDMFLNGDRLIVFTDDYDEIYTIAEFDFLPRPIPMQRTHAIIYDISDRSDPEKVKDFAIDGYYFQSRMIGDYVYLISKKDAYYGPGPIVPVIKEASTRIVPDVYYFDNPESNYVFHTITSINLKNEETKGKSFLMGYSNTVYVSQDNIYIAYQKNLPYFYYQSSNSDRFFRVVVPLLPDEVQDKIEAIKDDDLEPYEEWSRISDALEEMYNKMDEAEKEELSEEITKAIEEYEIKLEVERRKTVIHKIGIDNGDINYETKGEVPGYLLNQFSLDEFDNHLRVATTTELYVRNRAEMYNNVYVLDEDMDTVGEIGAIARDERIYSTRFLGDRLYMVTFKRVDPLFVIDLSNPENPKVLGELKIPGFSDYLHPYDEDHIIGIGKETEGNEWGGVSIKGVKVALFDVSDVENPEQVDSIEIGESGTDSEALRDHKAFLFDKRNDLVVIPIREIKGESYDERQGYYRQRIWQGAYVLEVSPENGVKVKGKISHGEEDDRYYWNAPSAVRRSLYMDDVLYTISAKKIMMNDIEDGSDINEVKLPFEEEKYYQYGWY